MEPDDDLFEDDEPRTAPCPSCGGVGIPIVYGLPAGPLIEAADRGEAVIGGCLIHESNPTHECVVCQLRWDQWEVETSTSGVHGRQG